MKHAKIIICILIVLWCSIIFYFSNKNSTDSNNTSREVISISLKGLVSITNKLKITNINLTTSWLTTKTNELNYPVRKCAHAAIYFILGILVFTFLYTLRLKDYQILFLTILLCFCYSLSDEYHQTFVSNRTGRIRDCLIDTTGSLVSSSVLYIFLRKKTFTCE